MRVIAVTSVLNEAPIIGKTAQHLLNQGVAAVFVSDGGSTDGTQAVLDGIPGVTRLYQAGPFDQAVEMSKLANLAVAEGADWVIPFDADEFFTEEGAHDIPGILAQVPAEVYKSYAPVWGHTDWDHRFAEPRQLPKVIVRAHENISLAWGQHDAQIESPRILGPLTVRELQYRDWPHFLEKIAKADALYRSYDFPVTYGTHLRRLVAMTDDELEVEWKMLQATETVLDPIPYRGSR